MSSTIGETPPQQVGLPQSMSDLEGKYNTITSTHATWLYSRG